MKCSLSLLALLSALASAQRATAQPDPRRLAAVIDQELRAAGKTQVAVL